MVKTVQTYTFSCDPKKPDEVFKDGRLYIAADTVKSPLSNDMTHEEILVHCARARKIEPLGIEIAKATMINDCGTFGMSRQATLTALNNNNLVSLLRSGMSWEEIRKRPYFIYHKNRNNDGGTVLFFDVGDDKQPSDDVQTTVTSTVTRSVDAPPLRSFSELSDALGIRR